MQRFTSTLILTLLSTAPAIAQLPPSSALSDDRLCERVVDERDPSARDEAKRDAAAGGIRGIFFDGCLKLADGKSDAATEDFDKAIHADTSNAVWQLWLGRAYGDRAEHANVLRQATFARRARMAFEHSLALAPDYLDAREALVHYALEAPGILGGGVDKARAQAEEITRRDQYRGGMAQLLIARHAQDTAQERHVDEMLVKQYPDSAVPRRLLITRFIVAHDWHDAWTAADDFQHTLPNDPRATFDVGRVAAESGEQLPRGERAMQEYLGHTPTRVEPTLAAAHYPLGQILEHGQNVAGAKQEYQAAVALDTTLAAAKRALERLR